MVNTFLDDGSSTSTFDSASADVWLSNKTTLNLNPVSARQYLSSYQGTQLLNISGQTLVTTSGATFTGDIICQNFTSNGTTTTINTQNLTVTDPLVSIGTNNNSNTYDLGQYGWYNNGSGQQFFSLFRDASDSGIVKVVHGLTNQPSSTVVDLTGAIKSTVQVGTLDCVNITCSGTSMTQSDLNKITGITNGTASAGKAIVLDSNLNSSGTNLLTTSSIKCVNDVRLTNTSGNNFVIPDTSFLMWNTSTNINSIVLEAQTEYMRLTPATGLTVPATAPHVNYTVSGATIGSSNTITVATNTSLLIISTSNTARVLSRIAPTSGSFTAYQEMTVVNKTANPIILGHKQFTSSNPGFLKAHWYILYPNKYVDMRYDATDSCWTMGKLSVSTFDFNVIYWANDDLLKAYLNTNIGTYVAKINFNNSGQNINSLGVFENCISTVTSGTNWALSSISGSMLQASTTGNSLTDTESQKFYGYIYNVTSFVITFSSLTRGYYYQLTLWTMDMDGLSTDRQLKIVDNANNKQVSVSHQQVFTTNAANSPSVMISYIFQNVYPNTSRGFTITNLGSCQIYGCAVVALGVTI